MKCDRNKKHQSDLLAQCDRSLVSSPEVVGSSLVWVQLL